MILNLTSEEVDARINTVLSKIFVLLIMETNSLLLHYTMSIFSITDSKAQVLIYHSECQDLPHCKLSPIGSSKNYKPNSAIEVNTVGITDNFSLSLQVMDRVHLPTTVLNNSQFP